MITNSEEANKYYSLVNNYIDRYTDEHKISPSKLGRYMKNNAKLIKFMERNGLSDVKNINRVISDVISDRIALEKDTIKTFEKFKIFESDEFRIVDLKQCLYKGVDKSNITHEKILADYFDVSLSHIDIISSDKHIFKIESLSEDVKCVIYNQSELEIIKGNIKEFCFEQVFNKKIKLDDIEINLNVNIKDFIDKDKFNAHINSILNIIKVKEIICLLLKCDDSESNDKKYFIGINPKL